MESKYTLTWEEYAELFSDSWPRPDYFSLIVVAMVSIPLISYGIVLSIFGIPDEHILNWMFIGGPLFLLLAASLSIASGSRKAKNDASADKRAEYDRWHAKEQLFSFDQEKWIYQSESGRIEVPWPALLAAVERPNVFYLLSESGPAIVPKRALNTEEVSLLRALGALQPAETWPFQITVWDNQATEIARLWKRYWFRMAFGNILGLVTLGWIFQIWLTSNEKIGIIWGWVLAAFAVVLALTAQIWYLPLKYWTSRRQWRAPKTMGLADRGLCFIDCYVRVFAGWKSFHHFDEVRRAFLIYTRKDDYYLLSKRYFSPEQRAELKRRLQKNVSGSMKT
jgi:hypothetical protein